MFRSTMGQLARWLPSLWEKAQLDSRKRFLLLLVCFNALLMAVLLLSVRNQEISRSIRIVEQEIRHRVEQLATMQSQQFQLVYITATPVQVAKVTTGPATVASSATPTFTVQPTPTATPTTAPQDTPTRTATPVPAAPTLTPRPTAKLPLPTPTVLLTPTHWPTPTWTPVATATSAPATPTSPPAGVPTVIRLSATQTQLLADGTSTSTVRATVLDQYGNPVSDDTPLTMSTNLGTFWGASTVTVLTHGGVAEAVLLASTTPGTATVQATADHASGSIAITFVAGAPATIAISASPGRLLAGSVTTLSVLVTDLFGNRVGDGTDIGLTATLGRLGSSGLRTRSGEASTTLTSDAAGSAIVTARCGASSAAVTVVFMPLVRIAKSVNRATAPAGSILIYTISITNDTGSGDSALLLTLTDYLPDGFAYVPGSMSSVAFAGEPAIAGQNLSWNASPAPYPLAPGSTIVSTFEVLAQAPAGSYTNQAIVQGSNLDGVDSGATAPVTLIAPSPVSFSPDNGCNNAPVNGTISGAGFASGARAYLGAWPLATSWVDEGLLNVVVPQDLPAGTHDLTVVNPGGSSATLPRVYRASNCGSLDTTLDSGYLGTYGAEPLFSPAQGDDDQIQLIYLEVPEGTSVPLYVRVFDPDCGGTLDIQNGWAWDTPFTFTIYGGPGTYTHPDARSAHPTAGASSGTVLATAVFAENPGTDGLWYSFGPFSAADAEWVGDKRLLKLTIVGGPQPPFDGGGRADLNVYNVALSTSATGNDVPDGARILAFSWTFLIPQATYNTPPRLFPYVGVGTSTLVQHNWDYDNDASGPGAAGIMMLTPLRTLSIPDSDVSRDNEERTSSLPTLDGESSTTWATSCWARPSGAIGDNLVTFWATDQNGQALTIFARSTVGPPP